jgi:hypothetical protein
MDKLFLPTMRARNLFAPDRCSVHLRILSRARLWLWAGDFQTMLPRTRQRKILRSATVRLMASLAPTLMRRSSCAGWSKAPNCHCGGMTRCADYPAAASSTDAYCSRLCTAEHIPAKDCPSNSSDSGSYARLDECGGSGVVGRGLVRTQPGASRLRRRQARSRQ